MFPPVIFLSMLYRVWSNGDMTSLKCLDLTGYGLEGGSAARLAEST